MFREHTKINDQNNIKNRNYNDNIKSTCETMKPLKRILKLFALDYNMQSENSEVSCYLVRSVITAVFAALLSAIALCYKIFYVYDTLSPSVKYMDAIQMFYDYFQYATNLFFVYKYGRRISIEYFKQYGYIDSILGSVDYPSIKRKIVKLLYFFFIIWLCVSVCDFIAWGRSYDWVFTVPAVYTMTYLDFLVKLLNTLDLTSQTIQIEARLKATAYQLHSFYLSTDDLHGDANDFVAKENWFYTAKKPHSADIQRDQGVHKISSNCNIEIKLVSRCYLMLIEQTSFINKMYGVRVLLYSLSVLIDMVRYTNLAIRLLVGTQPLRHDSGIFPGIASILRLLLVTSVFITLLHNCQLAYRQRERILSLIDHLLINKNPKEEVRQVITCFQDLVQSRPISFRMAFFFQLDYTLLASIASVVSTYTIILLQSMN